jgi:hypothetical protein
MQRAAAAADRRLRATISKHPMPHSAIIAQIAQQVTRSNQPESEPRLYCPKKHYTEYATSRES